MLSFLSRFLRASRTPPTQAQPARPFGRLRLGVESLEDRSVPTINGLFQGNVLRFDTPTVAADTLSFSIVGANLRVENFNTDPATDNIINGGGLTFPTAGNDWRVEVPAANVQKIIISGTATLNVGLTGVTLATAINGLANIKELNVTQPNAITIDQSTVTKAIYATYNIGGNGGTSTLTAPATGVTIAKFSVRPTASALTINTGTVTTGLVGLDFRAAVAAAGAGVSVNLLSSSVGGYTNQTISATDASKITGVYGSLGNDNIVGNNVGNLLIGGEGTDKILGGTADDEIYGTFSPTPAYGGTVGTQGGVPFVTFPGAIGDPIIDLALKATLDTQFQAAATANSFTAQSIANTIKYSGFNFGSGVAFLANTNTIPVVGGVSPVLDADITSATNYGTAQQGVTDLLFGDAGNNSMFGYAKTSVVANGTTGNNVGSAFSTSLSNTWQFGSGSSTYTLAFGDVANIATNNPTASGSNKVFFVGGTPSSPTFVSIGGVGTNELRLDNGAKLVQISTGTSKTSILGGSNDASNVVTLNTGSSIAPGLNLVTRIANTLA